VAHGVGAAGLGDTGKGVSGRTLLLTGALAAAALGLSGCIAFQAASAVAGAAVGTVTAVGRAVSSAASSTSRAVTRTVQQIPAQMMYGPYPPRRVVIPVRNPPPSIRTAPARSARPAAIRTAKSKPAKPTSAERRQILEVLPPEVLDRMTKDELILQRMIQLEALTSTADEIIYWDLDGHAGTAAAEPEHRMGGFTCRLITETVKLDATEDATATQSKATVCRTESTDWTLSF